MTESFWFTVLVLVVAAIALRYAYLYHTTTANSRWHSRREQMKRRIAAHDARIDELTTTVKALEAYSRKQGMTPAPNVVNPFQKSEERHAKELRQVVSINGEAVGVESRR